jgi:hypothetical protein
MWREKNGRKFYLVLWNEKWLKVVWNQVRYFFLFVLAFKKIWKVVPF